MHKLLARQLAKHLGSAAIPPELAPLLASIDAAYQAADEDRLLLERSLELTSRELLQNNAALRSQVADIRAAEAAVRESLAFLESLLASAPLRMFIARIADDAVSFATVRQGVGLVPVAPADLPEDFRADLDPGGALLWVDRLQSVRTVGQSQRFEGDHRFQGACRRLVITVAPVYQLSSQFCVILEDVTDLRRLEAKLRLQDRLASVGTLSAGVAHEINNPLTFVVGNIDHLCDRIAELPPELVGDLPDVLADMRDGADRVRRIVRDLRIFSRPEQDRRERVDVHAILDAAFTVVGANLRHRATLTRRYAAEGFVIGDPGRLGQVCLNLLVNASQAIADGDPEHNEIAVTTTIQGSWLVIDVSDTGCGIRPEIRDRIFEPFFTTKAIGEGTGVGLSICHAIVTGMGGDIDVESDLGVGSTFRVSLPFAGEPQGLSMPPARRRATTPAPRRARVLVIDDEPMVASMVQRGLRADHDVEVSSDARAAVRRVLGGDRFDMILCDLRMPGMTGIEVEAALASGAPSSAARLVFFSGGASEFVGATQRPLLDKPVDLAALRSLIKEYQRRDARG